MYGTPNHRKDVYTTKEILRCRSHRSFSREELPSSLHRVKSYERHVHPISEASFHQ